MAFLYITEFAEIEIGPAGRVGQFAAQPPLAEQAIVNTGASTQSAAFTAKTRYVRLHNDASNPVAVEFGTNPIAIAAGATGTARMSVNQTEYFGVPLGQSFKVAVVLTTP